MINPEQVPDCVINAFYTSLRRNEDDRIAITAALNAWPGAAVCHYTIADNEGYEMVLPLPFPQETRDDER